MGPITVIAFGSTDKEECEDMHARVNEMYVTAYDQVHSSKKDKKEKPQKE
jgi:hypothetical protein